MLEVLFKPSTVAVILGGGRTDLAIAALDTGASLLVLTGGIYPHVQVLNKAEMTGTPILMVPHDTSRP